MRGAGRPGDRQPEAPGFLLAADVNQRSAFSDLAAAEVERAKH
jgi:hypothetical protein